MNNSKKGQVTIFIIIAIVIVAVAIGLYFIFNKEVSSETKIPQDLEPVYSNFLSCAEQEVLTGAHLLGVQGGYIDLPEFERGSNYMPFSSQLNFLGGPIPYWFYVSGNNLEKEQVPSKSEMEKQLETFVEERIRGCEFQSYYDQGFSLDVGEPQANVKINGDSIELDLDMGLGIEKGNESVFVKNHKIETNSRLGSLYDSAIGVYEKEQNDLFLEEYGIDVLRSYAPVDGAEIQCSPLTWSAENVITDLKDALEVNTLALNENPEKYYNLNLPVKNRVRFLNSKNWPSTYEVSPNEGDFLVADPIGNQKGLGALGFCYVSYHFVYDAKYPVVVQVYNEKDPNEIFQFPTAVIIEGNNPRKPTDAEAVSGPDVQLCKYKNVPVEVTTYGSDSESKIDTRISYECLGETCGIGQTEDGVLEGEFPQCVNGYVSAKAEGYEESRYLLSTIAPANLEIVLDKIYEKGVDLKVDGKSFEGNAAITFISNKDVVFVNYPEDTFADLSEGTYDVDVKIYGESKVNLGAKTAEQCIDVSSPGILGSLGFTHEKCFDIKVPEQELSPVLIGGGKTEGVYFSESDLSNNNVLEIDVSKFETPDTLEGVQTNSLLYENSEAEVFFR